MLKNTNHLFGHKIAATAGDIGQLKVFYFDDQSRFVRYMVVGIGSWLSGRKVLLSPHSFGDWNHETKALGVKLTKVDIEHTKGHETATAA